MRKACRCCPQLAWCMANTSHTDVFVPESSTGLFLPWRMWVFDKDVVTFTCRNLGSRLATGTHKDKRYFQVSMERYDALS